MHEIFIYSGIENGDYTGSKHYIVYKLNVISQCSSVTPYLVLFSFFIKIILATPVRRALDKDWRRNGASERML